MGLSKPKLKQWAIKTYGYRCMSCGITWDIELDQILPGSLYKDGYVKRNVQLLCGNKNGGNGCNQRKSNVYIDDLRPLRAKLYYFTVKALRRCLAAIGLALFLAALIEIFYPALGLEAAVLSLFSYLASLASTLEIQHLWQTHRF